MAHPKISGTLYGGYNYHSTIVQLYTPSSILTHLIYGTVWLKFQKRYVKRSPSVTWEYLSSERIFDKVNFNALANAWNEQLIAAIGEGSFTYTHLGTKRKVFVADITLIDASDVKKFATKKVSANAEWAARRLIGAIGSINVDQQMSSSSAGDVELVNLVPEDPVDEAPPA